jgi:hypothetical protein
MPVESSDVTIHSNEWFTQTIRLLNPDKTPIDLTGFSAVCELGAFSGCDLPSLTLIIGSGIEIDAVNGRVSATATLAQLQSAGIVMGGVYRYKLTLLAPNGMPRVYRHGKLKVIC